MSTRQTPDPSEMNMSQEDAHALARKIRKMPGWKAKAFLGLWPQESGVYDGGWVVTATREGDDNAYMLKAPGEWPMLLKHLAGELHEGREVQALCLCCARNYLACECDIEEYPRDGEWECTTHQRGGLL